MSTAPASARRRMLRGARFALHLITVVLVVVGPALAGAAPRCHLYDPTYAHGHRRRSLPGSTVGRPT